MFLFVDQYFLLVRWKFLIILTPNWTIFTVSFIQIVSMETHRVLKNQAFYIKLTFEEIIRKISDMRLHCDMISK